MTQTEFLQAAIGELKMTRDAFATRVGCPRRTLDKWLLPESSNDYRPMPEIAWTCVREILDNEQLRRKVDRLERIALNAPAAAGSRKGIRMNSPGAIATQLNQGE